MRKYVFLPFFFMQQSNFCWNNTSAWNFETREYVNRQPPGTWLGSVLFLLCCYDWYASFTLDFSIIFFWLNWWNWFGKEYGINLCNFHLLSSFHPHPLQLWRFPLAVFMFLTLPSIHWSRETVPGFYDFSQLFGSSLISLAELSVINLLKFSSFSFL